MRSRVTPKDTRPKEYISEDPREVVEAPEEWGKDMWDAKRPEAQIIAGGLNHTHLSGIGHKICHLSKGMRSAFISETVKGIKHRKSRGLAGEIFKVRVESPGLGERMGDGRKEVLDSKLWGESAKELGPHLSSRTMPSNLHTKDPPS